VASLRQGGSVQELEEAAQKQQQQEAWLAAAVTR